MAKRKILVTTGTRAEYGFLRPVLQRISKSKKLLLYLVVTGTHLSKKHGFSIKEIKKDGFKIFTTIDIIPKGNTNHSMSIALGEGIIAFSKIFKKIKPDINLILGDRGEMLASALAAYQMNIPNAHIHGGDKTQGGIDEYTRHAITKISNIHFAATKKSYSRIIKMGEVPSNVFLTGSPSIDEIVNRRITSKKEIEKKFKIKLTGNEIILIYHPVTTQTELSGKQIRNILRVIIRLMKPTIAIAPNSDAGNKEIFDQLKVYSKKYNFFRLYPNVSHNDYLGFLKNCGVLVGNSSSGIIEASYFNIPVINIGIRQKGRERGRNVTDVSDTRLDLMQKAIRNALRKKNNKFVKNYIYGKGKASKKIVKVLEQIKLDTKLTQKQIFY